MTRAIGYVRVSTRKQEESGLGQEAQRKSIAELAAREGLTVAAIEEDAGKSGDLPAEKRPGLARALEALERGDVLVISDVDRLARNVGEGYRLLEELAGAGVSVRARQASSEQWLPFMLLLVVAENELRDVKGRVSRSIAAKRERGEVASGNVPFGHSDPKEKAAIALIEARARAGDEPAAIARALTAAGFRTRPVVRKGKQIGGRPYERSSIVKLLKRLGLPEDPTQMPLFPGSAAGPVEPRAPEDGP